MFNPFTWLHDEITRLHAAIARLEARAGIHVAEQTPPPNPSAEVAAVVAPKVESAPSTGAAAPAIDYSKFDTIQALILHLTRAATDAEIDAWMAAHPGAPDPRTHSASCEAVVSGDAAGDGWIPGSELGNGQNYRANTYEAGVPFAYSIVAPGPFEFVWSRCVGTPAGSASVVVSGPAGTFPSSSDLGLGSVKVQAAKKGEVYAVTFNASASGPGHAQINPLAPLPAS